MSAVSLLDARAGVHAARASVPRRLVVTWQHPEERGIRPVGFLSCDTDGTYSFEYIRNVAKVSGFRPLLGFPDLDRLYVSDTLFPLFAQRAMDARRADYSRHVTRLGLNEDSKPWEQIARSGGKRSGDTLQLFPVPTVVDDLYYCAFLVHGVRHMGYNALHLEAGEMRLPRESVDDALRHIAPGDELTILPEPGNPVNSHALLVATNDGVPIGYVPDLLVDDVLEIGLQNQRAFVEVVNGDDAPWHLRVLARLDGVLPPGFQFFSTDSWQSLAQ